MKNLLRLHYEKIFVQRNLYHNALNYYTCYYSFLENAYS